jgi:hypothetical protein
MQISSSRAAVVAVFVLSGCGSTVSPSSSPVPVASQTAAAPSVSTSTGPAASTAVATSSPDVGAPCSPKTVKFDPKNFDLTGPWAGDDEGIYYLRQRGSVLWWNGMSSRDDTPTALGRDWNNVGRGEIKDLTVAVDWADVPRGEIMGYGTLTLKIQADANGNTQIVKTAETGEGFGNSVWTPCSPG